MLGEGLKTLGCVGLAACVGNGEHKFPFISGEGTWDGQSAMPSEQGFSFGVCGARKSPILPGRASLLLLLAWTRAAAGNGAHHVLLGGQGAWSSCSTSVVILLPDSWSEKAR